MLAKTRQTRGNCRECAATQLTTGEKIKENPFHAPESYQNSRFAHEKVHIPSMPMNQIFTPFYATIVKMTH
jgi:hypothetical protein